jgi:arginine-tRNA-protein transferase
MKHHLSNRPTPFFVTAPLPCPYLTGQTERRIVTELTGRDASHLHDTLSRVGFRRSHGLIYAPICQNCSACLAVRTVVDDFTLSQSLRRVLRNNLDVTGEAKEARATTEQYKLFARYQESRHSGGDMATMDFYDYQALIEETPVDTSVIEYRDAEHTLIGASLVDRMSDGISAVYSFFDPDLPRRSLGTYMVLRLIDAAQRQDLPYVYLGYWIKGSRKMSYKERFEPLQYYIGGAWTSELPETVSLTSSAGFSIEQ